MSCSHIFVVGNSRSGTTLMGRILGRHPSVFTFDELHFFEELWTPEAEPVSIAPSDAEKLAARLLNIQRNGYLTQKDSQAFIEEASNIIKNLPDPVTPPAVYNAYINYEAHLHQKTIPCEQTPQNVFYIGEILKFFPEARVINMVRDPRDILLSQKRRWRRALIAQNVSAKEGFRYRMNYHPITISKLWNSAVGAAAQFQNDSRVHTVHFEALLSEAEETVHKICEFLGISFDLSLLDVPQVGSSTEQDQPERKGINKTRSESWRKGGLTPTEIFLCQKITQNFMEKYGYKSESVNPNPLGLTYSVVSFPFKLSLALVLSLKRMRKITDTLKRRLAS